MSTKLPHGYTEEDFKLLSPEERAGMLELAEQERLDMGLADTEEDGTGDAQQPPPVQQQDAPPPASQDTPPAVDPTAQKTPPADEAQQRAALSQMLAPAAERQPVALPDWKAPPDVDAKLSAAEQRKADLAQQFEDGDITSKEFLTANGAIEREIRDLDWLKRQAQMSAEATEHNFGQVAVPNFLARNDEYNKDPDRLAILDMFVRQEQTAAMKAGGSQYDPALLQRAHERVVAKFGGGTKSAPAVDPRPGLPPLLNGLPASDPEEVNQSEFAKISQLDGEAFEAAFARLSPQQQERYLQGG